MLFSSISYFIFFPIVFALYWIAPLRARRALLLVASYVFYMSWIPAYGLLIMLLTVLNYFIGWSLESFRKHSKVLLVFGLIVNLGTLCFFKYTNFLLANLSDLLRAVAPWMPFSFDASSIQQVNIILPLGISFFAFEFIHYICDVYKGSKAIRSPIDFALFAAFFPSQIAGPIKRYQDFIEQLPNEAKFDPQLCNQGIVLLLQGLFKKIALSDNLALLANQGFNSANTALATSDAWIAAMAFTFQIYFDFSGYTDMGRGSALMLGYKLPDNFNFPYLATSMSDFWKRWHISLSTWLRDYLYVPLGGGRCSPLRKYYNLMVTMLLGGLWHGAAWHFVAWGGLHGGLLIVNHKYSDFVERRPWLQHAHAHPVGKVLSITLTFMMVLVSWVFFRAETVTHALSMLKSMFLEFEASSAVLSMSTIAPLCVALSVYSIYALLNRMHDNSSFVFLRPRLSLTIPARAALYLGVAFAAVGLAPSAPSPFIYFQF
ncbi:MAG: hypothetical protein K2X77_16135 [Candidatus Obscuribacterales bacterium]|jgi:alginate O-acetyltransferase complex protein AlgI|nr:hypothetical protein [Candidatus Obscuribacterales bacterium]